MDLDYNIDRRNSMGAADVQHDRVDSTIYSHKNPTQQVK
jgi:hypothetical protein